MFTRTLLYLLCFALACLAAVGSTSLLTPLLTARWASIGLALVVSLGLAVESAKLMGAGALRGVAFRESSPQMLRTQQPWAAKQVRRGGAKPRLRRRGRTESPGVSGQAGSEGGERADDGASGLVRRRRRGSVAGHQVLEVDVPTPQRLQRFEALDEALASGDALQPPRCAKSVACGHVRAFDGLGRLAAGPVQARADVRRLRQFLLRRLHVRLVVVGDDVRRLRPGAAPCLPEERPGRVRIPPFAKEDVDHLAVLIDRPVQVPFLLALPSEEEDLVHVPAPSDAPAVLPDRVGQLWAEGLDPGEHRPGRHIHPSLREELLHVP